MSYRAKLLEEKRYIEKFLRRYEYEVEFGLYYPNSFDWFRRHKSGVSIELEDVELAITKSVLKFIKQELQFIYKELGLI